MRISRLRSAAPPPKAARKLAPVQISCQRANPDKPGLSKCSSLQSARSLDRHRRARMETADAISFYLNALASLFRIGEVLAPWRPCHGQTPSLHPRRRRTRGGRHPDLPEPPAPHAQAPSQPHHHRRTRPRQPPLRSPGRGHGLFIQSFPPCAVGRRRPVNWTPNFPPSSTLKIPPSRYCRPIGRAAVVFGWGAGRRRGRKGGSAAARLPRKGWGDSTAPSPPRQLDSSAVAAGGSTVKGSLRVSRPALRFSFRR